MPLARQEAGCIPRPLRPLPASQVSDGDEWAPVVSGAIIEGIGHLRIRVRELCKIIVCPARKLAAQNCEFVVVTFPEACHRCGLRFALEPDNDSAILESIGK